VSSITFFSEETKFILSNDELIKKWIKNAIISEKKELGEVSYVFCPDEYLYKINVEYLQHKTYTDIITFDYTEENVINGDIFISVERVKENAQLYKTTFENELNRVIIHGILHLLGYKDKSDDDAKTMRNKEDFYLSLLSI
jgi:rRNA maturation RNase YbeY